jgi:hypothetical protein
MCFAIIDTEGSTLDTFDNALAVTTFLGELLEEEPAAADEVGVIEYRDGRRLGAPVLAADFIAQSKVAHLQAVIARALQSVQIDPAAVLSVMTCGPSRAWIDIAVPLARADYLDAVVRESRSHRFPLAA